MASYQQTILADSPILYLRFEETAGASCADSSTSGFNGTAAGTFTRNVATGFAGLNIGITLGGGVADVVSVPNQAALNLGKPFTYECWAKFTSLPALGIFMSKGDDSGGEWGFGVTNTGVLRMSNMLSGTIALSSSAGAVTTATWYYLVFTKDNADNNNIYVNGTSIASNTVGIGITSTSQPFTVGANWNSGSGQFPIGGTYDEVAVYNVALSAAQVSTHYAARNSSATAGPSPTLKKSPPPSVVARVRKPHPVPGGPKGQPSPSPIPVFGHLDGELKQKDNP